MLIRNDELRNEFIITLPHQSTEENVSESREDVSDSVQSISKSGVSVINSASTGWGIEKESGCRKICDNHFLIMRMCVFGAVFLSLVLRSFQFVSQLSGDTFLPVVPSWVMHEA